MTSAHVPMANPLLTENILLVIRSSDGIGATYVVYSSLYMTWRMIQFGRHGKTVDSDLRHAYDTGYVWWLLLSPDYIYKSFPARWRLRHVYFNRTSNFVHFHIHKNILAEIITEAIWRLEAHLCSACILFINIFYLFYFICLNLRMHSRYWSYINAKVANNIAHLLAACTMLKNTHCCQRQWYMTVKLRSCWRLWVWV